MATEANSSEVKTEVKTEVFAAYQQLLGKLKATKKVTSIETQKEETTQRAKREHIEVIAQKSPADVSRSVADFKAVVIETLDELNRQMASKQGELGQVCQAIEDCKKELVDLYDIRAGADALAAIVLAQKDRHRVMEQEEAEFIRQRDVTRERDRVEMEARARQFEEKEAELRRAMQEERHRIEQEMRLKFDYEAKLLEKEMQNERTLFQQHIASLEAKIKHLESLKYSFNKLSFNTLPVDSME